MFARSIRSLAVILTAVMLLTGGTRDRRHGDDDTAIVIPYPVTTWDVTIDKGADYVEATIDLTADVSSIFKVFYRTSSETKPVTYSNGESSYLSSWSGVFDSDVYGWDICGKFDIVGSTSSSRTVTLMMDNNMGNIEDAFYSGGHYVEFGYIAENASTGASTGFIATDRFELADDGNSNVPVLSYDDYYAICTSDYFGAGSMAYVVEGISISGVPGNYGYVDVVMECENSARNKTETIKGLIENRSTALSVANGLSEVVAGDCDAQVADGGDGVMIYLTPYSASGVAGEMVAIGPVYSTDSRDTWVPDGDDASVLSIYATELGGASTVSANVGHGFYSYSKIRARISPAGPWWEGSYGAFSTNSDGLSALVIGTSGGETLDVEFMMKDADDTEGSWFSAGTVDVPNDGISDVTIGTVTNQDINGGCYYEFDVTAPVGTQLSGWLEHGGIRQYFSISGMEASTPGTYTTFTPENGSSSTTATIFIPNSTCVGIEVFNLEIYINIMYIGNPSTTSYKVYDSVP